MATSEAFPDPLKCFGVPGPDRSPIIIKVNFEASKGNVLLNEVLIAYLFFPDMKLHINYMLIPQLAFK